MRIYYDRKKWSIMSVAIECSDFYKDSNQNVCKKSKSSLFKIDTEKVSAVATYFFKFLVVLQFVLSTAVPILGAFGVLSSPITWIVAGTALVVGLSIAGGIYYYHRRGKEKNYEDPQVLVKIKEKSMHANFYKLYHKYGPENLVNHIFNETAPGPSIDVLREKFKIEVFGDSPLKRNDPTDFEHLNRVYDLDLLARLRIAPPQFVIYIKELQKEMDQIWHRCCQEKEKLNAAYPFRAENVKSNMQKIEYSLLDTYRMLYPSDFIKQMTVIPVTTAMSNCIDYGVSYTSTPLMQQQKYEEAMGSLGRWYARACQKIQERYQANYQNFFPSDSQGEELPASSKIDLGQPEN